MPEIKRCPVSRFQSTPSLRRATCSVSMFHGIKRVSIHALLAESDDKETAFVMNNHGFNPRPPCGERPGPIIFPFKLDRFQSTPSLRRATSPRVPHLLEQGVSIHALLAESDARAVPIAAARATFQSTPSLRRATIATGIFPVHIQVSIHALLAESDRSPPPKLRLTCSFNPRPPCGERLPQRYMLLINHASGALRQLHEDGTSHTVFSSSYLVVNLRFPMSYKNRRLPGNLM